jgi:transposase
MRRTTKYVALDVHQATTVSSVRDETGRVIARTIIPTEAPALLAFVRSMGGAVHVVFEEGTQAQWLSELLTPVVQRVVVCNRRGDTTPGNKNDQHDADDLSDRLRLGRLRAVYHGRGDHAGLKELTRTYANLLQDSKRVMQRLKALFRARGIKTPGMSVYHPQQRERWLAQLTESGARFRAETLYAQLGVLQALRPRVKAAMVQEAQRDPAWPVLRSIPYFGPVRIALLLATLQTPWRFRTKRHLWAYAGLAVVSRTSAEYEIANDRPVRRRKRWVQTRGLNRNHNPVVKDVFKSAATTAATRSGALQDWYKGICARGLSADLARVTLARKLAAVTLHLWKTGARYDPTQLSVQAH